MTSYAADLVQVRITVLAAAGVAWVALIAAPMPMLAHSGGMGSMPSSGAGLAASMAGAWLLMLLAMMLPVVVPAIAYIRRSSFARRRARSTALFLTGYFTLWIAAAPVLLSVGWAVQRLAPQPWIAVAVALGAALLWQFSPWKQRCLNRGHVHRGLAAFGFAADVSALRFGLVHGLWCAGSCWTWMLLPLLLPAHAQLFAMALVSGLIFAERIESPAPPRWQVRGLGTLTRMALAQARPFNA